MTARKWFWSAEEDATLRERAAEGAPALAAALQRSPNCVRARAARLGVSLGNGPGTPWTDADTQTLRALAQAGLSSHAAGRQMRRDPSWLRRIAAAKGIVFSGKAGRPPVKRQPAAGEMRWDEAALARLRRLAAEGLSGGQITAHFPGVSRNAVLGVCHRNSIRLGVGTARAARPVRAWSEDDIAALRRNARLGTRELTRILGRTPQAVKAKAGELGIVLGGGKGKQTPRRPARLNTPTASGRATGLARPSDPLKGEGMAGADVWGLDDALASPPPLWGGEGVGVRATRPDPAAAIPFLDALFGRCRTPIDMSLHVRATTDMPVCGRPVADKTSPGLRKSHCADCLAFLTLAAPRAAAAPGRDFANAA